MSAADRWDDQTCTTCTHSRVVMGVEDDGETEAAMMECWRYPPVVLHHPDADSFLFVRPTVFETDTCGEHSLS